jgi:hypothetical protein
MTTSPGASSGGEKNPRAGHTQRATLLAYAGVALLVMGMVLAIAGILTPPLFLPGTWIILLGILTCVAAAILGAVAARADASPATGPSPSAPSTR